MPNTYTDTEKQLIVNDITDVDISTVTFNTDELYLAPDNAVYSVNNTTPVNGNVTIDAANKDLSNLSATGNAKFQAPITGGASTITSSNLTANRALISNSSGKIAVSAVTSSQLGYLSTVTSNVQTQLNGKQETLVSGTNIKTINSTSLLGSGNIAVGTVTSVNNVSPVSGNVTITIPAKLSDLTDDTATYPIDKADYATSAGSATSATSATTASKLGSSDVGSATQPIYLDDGAATACTYSLEKSVPSNAVFTDTTYTFSTGLTESSGTVVVTDYNSLLKNTATGASAVSIGTNSNGYGDYSTAIGTEAVAASNYTTTLGYGAIASANSAGAIQIGYGTNSTANTLSVGFYYSPGTHYNYQLLDGTTGYIPSDRVNAVKEQRASGGLKFWTGTKAQYDAITTKDASTLYNITDDTNPVVNSWAYNYVQLAKDIAWTPNLPDTSYSLANYLPNDGYDYEVLVNVSITTGATSGNNVTLYFVSPAWGTIRVCSAVTRTSAGVYNSGTALVPVLANDRNITVKGNTSSSASGTYNIYLNGYRRA